MLTKGPALLVLSSLLFSSPAWAETGLSLKECLSLASRNNPQLIVSREEIERAKAGIAQAQAAWLPALGMTGNLTRQGALATTGGGLDLSYDLDFSGARAAQSALADFQLGLAREQAAQTAQQLRQDVVNAYYDLQHAFEQTRIAQLATSQAKALLEEATAMKSGGESTRFEVQRAELQVAQAQHEEIDARLNRRVLREALNRLIGFRDQDMFPSDPVREVGEWKGSFEDSLRLARENSPALKRYALQRAIAQERRRLALSSSGFKSAFFADADARGSYQGNWLSGPGLGPGYTVGARVSMSLFDGGAARASASQWEREAAITQAQ
ncbi:MAG: TolC family protein, partial [Bacteroidota bacterium]